MLNGRKFNNSPNIVHAKYITFTVIVIRAVILFCELLCVMAAALFDFHGVCHSDQAEIILHVYFTQFLSIIEKKGSLSNFRKEAKYIGFFFS